MKHRNFAAFFFFWCSEKRICSNSDCEKIRLEIVVFCVKGIQEIGWC